MQTLLVRDNEGGDDEVSSASSSTSSIARRFVETERVSRIGRGGLGKLSTDSPSSDSPSSDPLESTSSTNALSIRKYGEIIIREIDIPRFDGDFFHLPVVLGVISPTVAVIQHG